MSEPRSNPPRSAPAPANGRSPIRALGPTIARLPRYLALARDLLRDPQVPRWRKVAVAAALAYVVSPIDLVPGFIPVAGQLDDLAVLLLSLRVALRGRPAAAAEAYLRAARLSAADLDRDLATVGAAAAWIATGVARRSLRIGAATLRGAGKVIGIGARRAGARRARSERSRTAAGIRPRSARG
jgi:uncharacterized membrane protein YkvA (DUF1232 family)